MPDFTSDWFTSRAPRWTRVLSKFQRTPVHVLEIGSFEGRSSIFVLEYLPQSRITCVDPFCGSYEQRFDQNMAPFGARVEKFKSRSIPALDRLRTDGRRFDVIYIDGSHERQHVLSDSVLAWPLLKLGGLLIWDDYLWKRNRRPTEERPEHAIDLFCSMFSRSFKLLHRDYQVIVEKRTEWPAPLIADAGLAAFWHMARRWRRPPKWFSEAVARGLLRIRPRAS